MKEMKGEKKISMDNREKPKINALLNIDNFFGEHEGRLIPWLIFFAVIGIPLFFWFFLLIPFFPLKYFIWVYILYSGRMALLILCDENKKLKSYMSSKEDEYASVKGLTRIKHCHEDGLIEYTNGRVAYIIAGYPRTYISDVKFTHDMEKFISALQIYEFDLFLQMEYNEFKLQDDTQRLTVYTKKEMVKERMNFYIDQDAYCANKTSCFKYCFVIKSSRYDWKKLREFAKSIVTSSNARVFQTIKVCEKDEAKDVAARDLCAFVDLEEMLREKYQNDEFFGSEVLFYGDEVPDEYRKGQDNIDIDDRRELWEEEN